MSSKAFTKDVATIGITNILTSLGSFILLPVITKTLGAYNYGIWSQISATVSLSSAIALMGLSMALIRFLAAERDVYKIKEGFYSIVFFVTLSGLAISLTVFIFSDFMAKTIFSDPAATQYIKAGSFLILLTPLEQIVLFYFRVFRQIKTYAFFTIFNTLGRLFIITAILHIGFGLMGVIAAMLVIQGFIFLGAMLLVVSQIGFAYPKFTMILEYMRYGLPLTPNSLFRWVTDSSDRYIVGIILGINAVGIYSAAYSIGSLIQFLVTPIQLILFPELSKMYDENRLDEVKLYLSYALKYFLFLGIPSVVGLSILSQSILRILTKPEFIAGSSVIPFVALAGLMAGIFQIIINITHLAKRTQFNMFIHIIASLLNFLLNIILLPRMGFLGAAVATFAAYMLMVIVAFYISIRYISFEICWSFIAKSVISSVVMAGIIMLNYPESISALLTAILLGMAIYSTMIIVLGGINKREIAMLKILILSLRC